MVNNENIQMPFTYGTWTNTLSLRGPQVYDSKSGEKKCNVIRINTAGGHVIVGTTSAVGKSLEGTIQGGQDGNDWSGNDLA